MHTIQLSAPVYERLQALAIPFKDKEEEDVIVRLLDRAEQEQAPTASNSNGSISNVRRPSDLRSHVGSVPHGSLLRATYKGRTYQAEVQDGQVVWNGSKYGSLSKAAVAVIQSTGSKRPTESGWRFWEVKTPESSRWRPASDLRR